METSRRDFLKLLTAAGVSLTSASWLLARVETLHAAGELPVVLGPGVESWRATTCGFCPGGCGLSVRLIDDLPVGVRGNREHLVNEGKVCPAAHAFVQMLYGADRVQRPMRRTGGRGHPEWAEVSWEEAESSVTKRLRVLLEQGTPERIAFLDGRLPGLGQDVARAFMRALGSRHYVPVSEPQEDAIAEAMFGWSRAPGADLERARTVLMVGFDGLETDGAPVWQSRVYARMRDRTIDRPLYLGMFPRLLGSAAKCGHWLPARPGTEGLVVFAMIHQILADGSEDSAFLRAHTDWDDEASRELRALIGELTPAVASDHAGMPSERITMAARLFAEHRPGVALAGRGLPGRPTATMTHVAVNVLNAIVGNVGVAGGCVERPEPPLARVWEETAVRPVAGRPEPGITRLAELERAITAGAIDVLFVREAHPVFESARALELKRAFAGVENPLVIVFATEHDETTRLANLVLPESTFAERWDLLVDTPVVPRAHVSLQRPVVPPLFSAQQSEDVLLRIVDALGPLSRVRFGAPSAEKLVRLAAEGLATDDRGGTYAVTRAGDGSARPTGGRAFWKAFERDGVWAFDTASIEPAPPSKRMVMLPRDLLGGAEGAPAGGLRALTAARVTGEAAQYPYLLTMFRVPELRDGQLANYPTMMELGGHWGEAIWETWAELHPRTAAEAGAADGGRIRIVSALGAIVVQARVTEAVAPGVVAVPVGLGHEVGSTAAGVGANPNTIADASVTSGAVFCMATVTRVAVRPA